MKDFKKRLDSLKITSNQKWKKDAKFNRDNKWQVYSSEIALRILALIENNSELNQTRLAEALNVSRQQVNKIIKGRENLTLETIYNLSQALNFELITFPNYKDSYELGPFTNVSSEVNSAQVVAIFGAASDTIGYLDSDPNRDYTNLIKINPKGELTKG